MNTSKLLFKAYSTKSVTMVGGVKVNDHAHAIEVARAKGWKLSVMMEFGAKDTTYTYIDHRTSSN